MREGKSCLQIFWAALVVIVCALSALQVSAKVWTDPPDWVGGRRNLRIFVPPGSSQAFKDAVQDAIDAWNADNGDWTLTPTTDQGAADVDVSSSDPGGGYDGLTTANGTTVGGARTTHMSVQIKPSLTGDRLQSVLMHELGHCMRMDHTTTAGDIMHPSALGEPLTPSTGDRKEADAAAKNEGRVYSTPTWLLGGTNNQTLWIYPQPGSGLSFVGLEDVSVMSLTGEAVEYEVVSFDSTGIRLSVDVDTDAAHNEVYQLDLDYGGPQGETATAVLCVVEDAILASDLPHAVAGLDITSSLGAGVLLDGTDSYHDVSSQTNNLGLCWCIELANDDVMWILNGGAVVDLPVGVHVATLHALDYYGQSAEDSLTITITSP